MRIEEHLKDVNSEYVYKDDEIDKILFNRAKYLHKENRQVFGGHVIINTSLYTEEDGKLKTYLLEEQKKRANARKILLPCNVYGEWIGLMIEMGDKNKEISISYLNSAAIGDAILDTIKTQIKTAIPECKLKSKTCWQRENITNATDSYVYVIENLLEAARVNPSSEEPNVNLMRAWHLQSLEMFEPEFYLTFRDKQLDITPIMINSNHDKIMPVSDEINLLFQTLVKFDVYIDELFTPEKGISKKFDEKSKELYTTVCDENGKLRLRFVDAAKNKNLVQFRSVVGIKKDIVGFLIDYSGTMAWTTARTSASVLAGIAGESWILSSEVVAATTGRILLVANPWFIAASIIFSIGSIAGTHQARLFAQNIQKAAELADSGDKDKLIEALKILQSEFGEEENSRNKILSMIGYYYTPPDQYNFAYLLLMYISQQLNKPGIDYYKEYSKIHDSSANEYIKCMCLVAQIAILEPHAAWLEPSKEGKEREPNNNMDVIKQKSKILNSHQNFVQQYFIKVLLAYKEVFKIVQNQEYLKDIDNFAKTRSIVDKLLSFRDLKSLRFMTGPGGDNYGEFAELAMTFTQAIVKVIYKLHYKTKHSENNSTMNDIKRYSDEVFDKLKECEKLINIIKNTCKEVKEEYSVQAKIIECIQIYIKEFYREHSLLTYDVDKFNTRIIEHQFSMSVRGSNNSQIEQAINRLQGAASASLTEIQKKKVSKEHLNLKRNNIC